jgi:hypothetical protein
MDYFAGLDLGQAHDYSALGVIERDEKHPAGTRFPEVTAKVRHYAVRHLQRWPLGTSYPQIVKDVGELLARPPLTGCKLVIDGTGVGRPVVDLFRKAVREGDCKAQIVSVTITGGERPHFVAGGWNLPKKELAGVMQVLLQDRRLKIAEGPERDTLLKELRAFRVKVKVTTGHETFEAWRERDHDDMVFAVSLPLWLVERGTRSGPGLRVFKIRGGGDQLSEKECRPRLKIVACSREQLAGLEIADHPALLVSVQDPTAEPRESEPPPHALGKLLGSLQLTFADLNPNDHGPTWNDPIAPYGRPVTELVMRPMDGKRLWRFLTGRHTHNPEVFVFADDGDRRALSPAYAVADVLRFPRKGTIYVPEGDPDDKHDGPAPNRHVYDLTKSSRALVV